MEARHSYCSIWVARRLLLAIQFLVRWTNSELLNWEFKGDVFVAVPFDGDSVNKFRFSLMVVIWWTNPAILFIDTFRLASRSENPAKPLYFRNVLSLHLVTINTIAVEPQNLSLYVHRPSHFVKSYNLKHKVCHLRMLHGRCTRAFVGGSHKTNKLHSDKVFSFACLLSARRAIEIIETEKEAHGETMTQDWLVCCVGCVYNIWFSASWIYAVQRDELHFEIMC